MGSRESLGVTVEEVKFHAAQFLANVSIRMLALGNLYKDVGVRCMTPFHVCS